MQLKKKAVTYETSQLNFDQDDECTFCYELLADTKVVRLPCSDLHVFHFECIEQWLTTNQTCPVCRSEVSDRPRQFMGNVFIYEREETQEKI